MKNMSLSWNLVEMEQHIIYSLHSIYKGKMLHEIKYW